MYKSFYLIICILLSNIIFIACISNKDELLNNSDEIFISHLDSLLGSNPELVCNKIDSIISSGVHNDEFYSLLMIKSKAKLFLSEYDSVFILLDSIERYCSNVSEKNTPYRLLSSANNMRGNLYARRSVMDSAIIYFQKAYNYSSKLGLSYDLIDITINLADANVRSGKFDLGSFWYRRSLSISDTLMLPENRRFPSYYGLAQVYMDLRDYDKCDFYYDLAGRYFDDMLPFEKHIYLNNRGNSYYYRGEYDKAMDYFRKSLQLVNRYPDMEFERKFTKVNMGEVFMLMNETDSATAYLEECYSFFKSINHTSALYYIETQLIELALKKNNISLASKIIRDAVQPDFIEPNMLHIRNKYLQHYYAESGDYKKAYYYQQNNAHIDDSIRNERIKMRSAEISLRYRQDSTLMKKEMSIKEKEGQVLVLHQWISILVLAILLFISFSGMFIIYRKRRFDKRIWNMQTDISTLRLENIRNRISPHFIFNVLNREMVRYTNEDDKSCLVNLSKLIRKNLELTENLSISLNDELDFVKTYITLQEQTLGEDFHYEVNVSDDVVCEDTYIPSMLIQIPVENSIKHALKVKKGKKCLWINVNKNDAGVEIVIVDNGGGFRPVSSNRGTGTGLKVITQTIQLLNMYNKEQIVMKISNVKIDENEIGCEIRYSVPGSYKFKISK